MEENVVNRKTHTREQGRMLLSTEDLICTAGSDAMVAIYNLLHPLSLHFFKCF